MAADLAALLPSWVTRGTSLGEQSTGLDLMSDFDAFDDFDDFGPDSGTESSDGQIVTIRAPEGTAPERMDRFLAQALSQDASAAELAALAEGREPPPLPVVSVDTASLPPLSRSRIKNLIMDGCLAELIDGQEQVLKDPSATLRPDVLYMLRLPPPVDATPKGENIALDVLFEDAHIIVLNKPAGMVVHPAPGQPDGTLVNALINHCGPSLTGIGGVMRPGIVHRLDKDTSGVMMAAKTDAAHHRLSEMFAAHDLDRRYHALVWGIDAERAGTVDEPLGRSDRDRKKQAVMPLGKKGKRAVTHWSVSRIFPPFGSLVECQLETGRTHQIRVHMAHIGHGVIGDPLYGKAPRAGQMPDNISRTALSQLRAFDRQALHAAHLGFAHPITGEALAFSADLPPDMAALLGVMEHAVAARAAGRR